MMKFDSLEGVNAKVQILRNRFYSLTVLLSIAIAAGACGESGTGPTGAVDLNSTAATVNGKAIKMEDVERAIKQQSQGQPNQPQLSALELAGARLQILQGLIEQEVMFQKAEKEGTVPTDDDVNAEFNKRKTESRLSAEQFQAEMEKIGETEASARLAIKRGLAIQKLNEKVTGKIEPPKDSEIELFFSSNKEAFKNKRGAQLAAIVFDPRDLGEGDPTKNDLEAQTKAAEIGMRVMRGADFATVARENSEDSDTRLKGGDWRYFTEEQMKQVFPQGFAEDIMTRNNGDIFPRLIPFENRYLIIKLQRKQEADEDRTLETPGVKQEITDALINSRKQLLAASYQAIAMHEARGENFLAKKVVDHPNARSGARPASLATPAPANTASTPAASNTSNGNTNARPAAPATNTTRPAASNTNR